LAESQRVSEQNDRLRHLLRQLQRNQFGRRSERLDADQLQPSSAAPGPARPTSRSPSPAAASATRPVPASTTSSISSIGSRLRRAPDAKAASPITSPTSISSSSTSSAICPSLNPAGEAEFSRVVDPIKDGQAAVSPSAVEAAEEYARCWLEALNTAMQFEAAV